MMRNNSSHELANFQARILISQNYRVGTNEIALPIVGKTYYFFHTLLVAFVRVIKLILINGIVYENEMKITCDFIVYLSHLLGNAVCCIV